jgi:hypothetical protein
MSRTRTQTRKTKAQVKKILNDLPGYVSGRKRDTYRVRKVFWSVFTHELYRQIHIGFVAKSMGGTDDQGESWLDIRDSTKRRKGRNEILQHTEKLRQSLKPGTVSGDSYAKKNRDQIVEYIFGNKRVVYGSKLPYAKHNHEGTNRIPARRLWPENLEEWISRATTKAIAAVVTHLTHVI